MEGNCVAICSNGNQCTKIRKPTLADGTRCGMHNNSIIKYGPHTTARRELTYANRKEAKDFKIDHDTRKREQIQQGVNNDAVWIMEENHQADMRVMRARHGRAMADLVVRQREEIHETGVDPDAAARDREREDRLRRMEAWRHRVEAARRMAENLNNPNNNVRIIREAPIHNGPRQLANFVADPQNVHTTEAVQQTKDIVARVREIPVPEGYRWNTSVVSKTIGEIIADCQLTSHAAAQMFNQYVSSVAVYDIEEGIYGKVLDCVWQYIKSSPDKEDLCRILKHEMIDNIGMCAQGNLSRICNILAGYMEGIGAQESLSERLGRLLPPLMEIDDVAERIRQACIILSENNTPPSEWATWIDPLMEDEFIEFYELIREQLIH